jgi:hypothetical protein
MSHYPALAMQHKGESAIAPPLPPQKYLSQSAAGFRIYKQRPE